MTIYRQGDVLISGVAAIPKEARPKVQARIVLALGEATGHAHVIEAPPDDAIELTTTDNERFLRIVAPVRVTHEEHAPIELPPGEYRISIQREYDPLADRLVTD